MNTLRICFTNFWPEFDENSNFITDALTTRFSIEVVGPDNNPDLHFYSLFGNLSKHYKYTDRIRIYYTSENDVPNFTECDYAISTHHIKFGTRHFRLPIYTHYNDSYSNLLNEHKLTTQKSPLTRRFCCAVISNNTCADPIRDSFIHELSRYKTVDCGGRHNNNIGKRVTDKISFCSDYKFCISFENSRVPYYTTEKLPDALYAGCVPIYWGDPFVHKEFSKDAFIDISDFKSAKEAIEYIKEVDNDPKIYLRYLEANPLTNTVMANWVDNLCDFIRDALLSGKQMVDYGANRRLYRYTKLGAEMRSYDFLSRNFDNFIKIHNLYESAKDKFSTIKQIFS